jgi:hypothetical protein
VYVTNSLENFTTHKAWTTSGSEKLAGSPRRVTH